MSGCRKRRYRSRLRAQRALGKIAMRRQRQGQDSSGHEMKIYRCPRCSGYHLTSQL